jgi:hypothetical protein
MKLRGSADFSGIIRLAGKIKIQRELPVNAMSSDLNTWFDTKLLLIIYEDLTVDFKFSVFLGSNTLQGSALEVEMGGTYISCGTDEKCVQYSRPECRKGGGYLGH